MEDAPAEELDGAMMGVPPGCDGLRCRPQLASPGAGLPPDTRGRLAGLRLSHGRAHLLRAVLEGLSLELARYLGFLTDAGIAVDRLVMCGGAAASRLAPQIVADATGLPVSCVTERAVSAHGAAVVARALAEGSRDLAGLSTQMAPPVRSVEPGAAAPLYRQLLNEYVASLPKRHQQETS
jgi:xylulokinase